MMFVNESFKHEIYGIILTVITLLVSGAFVYALFNAAILPLRFMIIGCVVLLILSITVFVLTCDSRRCVRLIIGTVVAAITLALVGIGWYFVHHGVAALEKISTPEKEYAHIGVYVETDDPAQSINDAADYTFGILESLDRDATDKALEIINKKLGKEIIFKEYAGVGELADALITSKEVKAIILNESFPDLLGETEGYEGYPEKLREIFMAEVEVNDPTAKPEIAPRPENEYFTMYISGIDCHGSIARRSRSDVNIIATVNTRTGQILLLSTPRDYFVPLSISNGIPDKLTHAGVYGIQVSKDTLGMLYETEIDYYFRVNFDGFEDIIDALGGITVHSEVAFKKSSYTFSKGENFLDGKAALIFARERYSFAAGDRQRGKNQMAVINGVIQKATSSTAALTNYKAVLDGVTGSFETNMPYDYIAELIQLQLTRGTKWNVVSYSVDGTGDSQKPYSMSSRAYVMIPNQGTVDHAKELIAQVKNGQVPQP